jgi:hypothetical protein
MDGLCVCQDLGIASVIVIFQQLSDTRSTQPLQMEKCASNFSQRKVNPSSPPRSSSPLP